MITSFKCVFVLQLMLVQAQTGRHLHLRLHRQVHKVVNLQCESKK